jgi:hypothetical protein
MEGLYKTHHTKHLTTSFFNHLEQYGWNKVNRYFDGPHRKQNCQSARPKKSGEPIILMPFFVNQNHWVAVARREFNNRTIFLYSDDMQNKSVEQRIKLILFNHTDAEFCPANAEWINCMGTYYHPHSNECGPHTILALHIFALHTSPSTHIVKHAMHENIAQITRIWVAKQLASGILVFSFFLLKTFFC